CSLIDVCQPRLLDRGSVDQWVRRQLNADED
ncbi:CRISPR-associated protein Cas4, partial [Xanthomonas oryzae pv. oryzae]